jgi:hypothetical protein
MMTTSQVRARGNRRRPSASAPSRGDTGGPCRQLSDEELILVLGVLVGTNLEIPVTASPERPSARHMGNQRMPLHPRRDGDQLHDLPESLPERSAEIVQLARQWAPFGGPPEDEIYVRFGITRECFMQRLAEVNSRRGWER